MNLTSVVRCPLTKTLCKIMQGRIGEIILSGMSLYLGIFSRVWLKSISITVMSLLRDSKMAIA